LKVLCCSIHMIRVIFRHVSCRYCVSLRRRTGTEHCDERVCVCTWVCLSVREHVLVIASVKFTKILCMLPVAVTQFSSDTLCTSGIVDDVTFLVMGRWWRLAAATATPPLASCLLFASCPKPNSHRPPDMTRQCCLCRVRRCELSIETVWQSLNS